MSAKRPAAPVDQTVAKRSRVQDEVVVADHGRRSASNQVAASPKQSSTARSPAASNNSVQHSNSPRNAAATRGQVSHAPVSTQGSHSQSAGALNMAVRGPRAAHSGSGTQSNATPRANFNAPAAPKASPSNSASNALSSLSAALKQPGSSNLALANLLPLLYGPSGGEKSLEVAAAQLASGALKQTASGQSQSLLGGLPSLGNVNLTNLSVVLNHMVAMQKYNATPTAAKKDSPATSQTQTSGVARSSSSSSFSKTPTVSSSAQKTSNASSAAQRTPVSSGLHKTPNSTGSGLKMPGVLSGVQKSSTADSAATLHHHAQKQSLSTYGTSDAPIDLSKKTTPQPSAFKPRASPAMPALTPAPRTRAEATSNDRSVERERERAKDILRSAENLKAPVLTEKAVNGAAERQIPVITLSDDEEEVEQEQDDETMTAFDEQLAEVERLTDSVQHPDREVLVAARRRLVRDLQRTLCDEETRVELLRRWTAHNSSTSRDQKPTVNGKGQSTTQASLKGVPQVTKQGNAARSGSNTPQPAHAHGNAMLNGGPPNVTINQQAAHGGQTNTPTPLKVPRVASSTDTSKLSAASNARPQSNATPNAGKSQVPQKGTSQLSASQLQAQLTAAKLALRKQVEKSLAQLPPPKPVVAADIQFVPSVNYTDLLCLVGLDETVNGLQRFEAASKNSENGHHVPPMQKEGIRVCVQCETDFTPIWRVAERSLLNAASQKKLVSLRENAPNAKFHVCERCAVHNQKKTSRNEYLAKLKQTFTQLARDERELDDRYSSLIAQAPQSVPNTPSILGGSGASNSGTSSLHATPSGSRNTASVVQNALKEAQQLLSNSTPRASSSSSTPSSASLAAGLGSLTGSQSFNSASALSAFSAFTAAMNAAANAMKSASPNAALNLSAAGLGNALSANSLGAGLSSSSLSGGINPANLGAALQAFLSLQSPTFAASSRSATSHASSSSAAFPSQFSSGSPFNVSNQQSNSGASPVKTTADLHRQYYLEMVNKPPVLPSWKK